MSRQYAEYRDSATSWVGEMPAHWRVASLKWISRRYSGGTPDKARIEYWEDGTIPWLNSGAVNDQRITAPSAFITEDAFQNSSAKWIPPRALVMALAGQGKTKGMVAQVMFETTCNQSMAAIVPSEERSAGYLLWWLTSNYQNIRNMAGGDLRDGLNLELLGAIPCPLPEVAEQVAIGRFLDRETAKIDALIAEQEKLIALLAEKRQATITHAVTRGLNPHVALKDSGIPWLGRVPTHWGVGTLTRIAERIVVGIAEAATHAYQADGVAILRSTNIRPGRIVGDILRIDPVFAAERGSKLIRAGDLITVRTGNAGVTAEVPPELDQCQCFTMLITTLHPRNSPSYYSYWANSTAAKRYFETEGWGAAQANISVPILKELPIAIPPPEEQLAIADFLKTELRRLDNVAAEASRTIDILRERRSALITAAVTGQIDVRNAAGEPA